MKKRIKLTDKELAIGMWVYICLYIESYDRKSYDIKWIARLKKTWMEKHYKASYLVNLDYYWLHDCWLCHKNWRNGCLRCPLEGCTFGSLYDGVLWYYQSKDKQENALICAKRILDTIAKTKEEEHEENED